MILKLKAEDVRSFLPSGEWDGLLAEAFQLLWAKPGLELGPQNLLWSFTQTFHMCCTVTLKKHTQKTPPKNRLRGLL